jgi:hypothetical protein
MSAELKGPKFVVTDPEICDKCPLYGKTYRKMKLALAVDDKGPPKVVSIACAVVDNGNYAYLIGLASNDRKIFSKELGREVIEAPETSGIAGGTPPRKFCPQIQNKGTLKK